MVSSVVHVVFLFIVLLSFSVRESLQLMMSQHRYSDHDDRQGVRSSVKLSSFVCMIQGLWRIQLR